MTWEILSRNLVALFVIALFSVKLWSGKQFRNTDTQFFWLTLVSCLFLILENVIETATATDPSLRFVRTMNSVIGYTMRSTAALGLLLVIVPEKKRGFVLWIPSLITLALGFTAFFTDLVFSFNEDYVFARGPLGYALFIAPVFYLCLILWIVFRQFSEKAGAEKIIAPLCAVFCLAASAVDIIHGSVHLNEAILISGVFFYMVLYSHDNRRDPLTGLLNRQAFYDDCVSYGKNVVAVASVDMNGLKRLNDRMGHQAGDEALTAIGECLNDATDRSAMAYRIGGDEFAVLFLQGNEERVRQMEKRLRERVGESGYSISFGHALRAPQTDLNEAIRESDQQMYADKERYYCERGVERRK